MVSENGNWIYNFITFFEATFRVLCSNDAFVLRVLISPTHFKLNIDIHYISILSFAQSTGDNDKLRECVTIGAMQFRTLHTVWELILIHFR